jgi:hypothetical protein
MGQDKSKVAKSHAVGVGIGDVKSSQTPPLIPENRGSLSSLRFSRSQPKPRVLAPPVAPPLPVVPAPPMASPSSSLGASGDEDFISELMRLRTELEELKKSGLPPERKKDLLKQVKESLILASQRNVGVSRAAGSLRFPPKPKKTQRPSLDGKVREKIEEARAEEAFFQETTELISMQKQFVESSLVQSQLDLESLSKVFVSLQSLHPEVALESTSDTIDLETVTRFFYLSSCCAGSCSRTESQVR